MVQNRIEEGQNEFSSEAVTELIKVKNQVWVINMTHYLGRFSFKRWISAISFSGLGPGISKRFFASYSWLSVVSQKNMDFFRNCPITRWSADHFRLVLYRRRGTFIFRNMSIWVSLIHIVFWVYFRSFSSPCTLLSWFFVKIRFSNIIYGASWNLKSRF